MRAIIFPLVGFVPCVSGAAFAGKGRSLDLVAQSVVHQAAAARKKVVRPLQAFPRFLSSSAAAGRGGGDDGTSPSEDGKKNVATSTSRTTRPPSSTNRTDFISGCVQTHLDQEHGLFGKFHSPSNNLNSSCSGSGYYNSMPQFVQQMPSVEHILTPTSEFVKMQKEKQAEMDFEKESGAETMFRIQERFGIGLGLAPGESAERAARLANRRKMLTDLQRGDEEHELDEWLAADDPPEESGIKMPALDEDGEISRSENACNMLAHYDCLATETEIAHTAAEDENEFGDDKAGGPSTDLSQSPSREELRAGKRSLERHMAEWQAGILPVSSWHADAMERQRMIENLMDPIDRKSDGQQPKSHESHLHLEKTASLLEIAEKHGLFHLEEAFRFSSDDSGVCLRQYPDDANARAECHVRMHMLKLNGLSKEWLYGGGYRLWTNHVRQTTTKPRESMTDADHFINVWAATEHALSRDWNAEFFRRHEALSDAGRELERIFPDGDPENRWQTRAIHFLVDSFAAPSMVYRTAKYNDDQSHMDWQFAQAFLDAPFFAAVRVALLSVKAMDEKIRADMEVERSLEREELIKKLKERIKKRAKEVGWADAVRMEAEEEPNLFSWEQWEQLKKMDASY